MKHCIRYMLFTAAVSLWCLGNAAFATTTFYHTDALGSPILATNFDGAVIWRASYRPFGDRDQGATNYAASLDNPVWFSAHVYDEQTGLAYMQARYYNPVLGRFISPDPAPLRVADPQTLNRYAYARNNPYRYIDPDGRESVALLVKASGSAGAGGNLSMGVYFSFPFTDDVPFDAGVYSGAAGVAGVDGSLTVNLVLLDGGRENLEGPLVTVSATAPLTGVAGPAVDGEVSFNPKTGKTAGSSLGIGLAATPSASVAYGFSSIDFSLRDTVGGWFGGGDTDAAAAPPPEPDPAVELWLWHIAG